MQTYATAAGLATQRALEPKESWRATQKHVPALDGVRGVAILLVLLFHFPAPFGWLRPVASVGWCGVDLFFVLSGYLITGVLYSSAGDPHYFRNFYIRRSLRIFPLYYGFLVLVLFILPVFVNAYWLGLEDLHGRGLEFFLYWSNYRTVFVGLVPATLAAFWSLAVEEHFYVFWPVFMKRTARGRLLFWCAVIALAAVAGRVAIAAFRVTWLADYFLSTSRVDSLVVGAMTAIVVRQYPEWPRRWMAALGGAMLILLAGVAVWRRGLNFADWPIRTFGYSALALLFASLVWLAGNTRGPASRLLSNSLLVTLGKYSYCLYVSHMLVLTVCERWVGPRFFPLIGWTDQAPLPLFTVSMSASLLIAYASWRLYERPILSWKARFGA